MTYGSTLTWVYISGTAVSGRRGRRGRAGRSHAVGEFWSAALDWPLVWDEGEETAVQSPAGGPKITWGGPPLLPKHGRTRWRFDLVPADGADAESEAARLVALGGIRLGTDEHGVVVADPDTHEHRILHTGW